MSWAEASLKGIVGRKGEASAFELLAFLMSYLFT
jgi:hypothetical protein